MAESTSRISDVLRKYEDEILSRWIAELAQEFMGGIARSNDAELKNQCRDFIKLIGSGFRSGQIQNLETSEWKPTIDFLEAMSKSQALQGFTAEQTALFVLSSKKHIFAQLQTQQASSEQASAVELLMISEVVDKLSLHTIKTFQKTREAVILRQQEELLELSTPVVKLWDGVLALPIIGTLDSARTQVVMESLLQRIVDTESEIAIIDITGVPTVDTLVAQHLIKTVTAIRLMGADCIISGIRPQIAQTIVHLGVDLQGITTKSTLAEALRLAFKRLGLTVNGTQN
ncbi:STAS domain-containing protein [Schlesneria sp. T3-172]|uniref:STAS domain-containing protein n=1 Tax=Schlesneria sphaerica TaxID=3373610 RepID=UPI0037C9BC87